MSRQMSVLVEGRLIEIERLEEETDAQFAERSSFILSFRNDTQLYERAKLLSFHHTQKMFKGTTYNSDIEAALRQLREMHNQLRKTE